MESGSPVQLIHNPGAGSEDHHKTHILNLLKTEGWDCRYYSSKDDFSIDNDVRMVIVGGGDGTVRKVASKIAKMEHKPLIAVLPLGTANNVANTLGFPTGTIDETIRSWTTDEVEVQFVNTGIARYGKEKMFFLEGVGFGLFPELIVSSQNEDRDIDLKGDESLKFAREKLYELSKNYDSKYCELTIDGQTWSGEYCMIEVLNMQRVGPGLTLAPSADLNDGMLDVMIVPEKDRRNVETYLLNIIEAGRDICSFPVIRGKHVEIKWAGENMHVDDQLITMKKSALLEISVASDSLSFIAKR